MRKNTDWYSIRTAYVTGTMSQVELAKEMNVHRGTLAGRACREKWGKARRDFRRQMMEKAIIKRMDSEAKCLASRLDAAEHSDQGIAVSLGEAEVYAK